MKEHTLCGRGGVHFFGGWPIPWVTLAIWAHRKTCHTLPPQNIINQHVCTRFVLKRDYLIDSVQTGEVQT